MVDFTKIKHKVSGVVHLSNWASIQSACGMVDRFSSHHSNYEITEDDKITCKKCLHQLDIWLWYDKKEEREREEMEVSFIQFDEQKHSYLDPAHNTHGLNFTYSIIRRTY